MPKQYEIFSCFDTLISSIGQTRNEPIDKLIEDVTAAKFLADQGETSDARMKLQPHIESLSRYLFSMLHELHPCDCANCKTLFSKNYGNKDEIH